MTLAMNKKPIEYRDVWVGALYGRASTKDLVEAESLKKQEYLGLRYAEQRKRSISPVCERKFTELR
jgi:hypothetical protein